MERPGQFIYHEEHEVHEEERKDGTSFVAFMPFVVESDFGQISKNLPLYRDTSEKNFDFTLFCKGWAESVD